MPRCAICYKNVIGGLVVDADCLKKMAEVVRCGECIYAKLKIIPNDRDFVVCGRDKTRPSSADIYFLFELDHYCGFGISKKLQMPVWKEKMIRKIYAGKSK